MGIGEGNIQEAYNGHIGIIGPVTSEPEIERAFSRLYMRGVLDDDRVVGIRAFVPDGLSEDEFKRLIASAELLRDTVGRAVDDDTYLMEPTHIDTSDEGSVVGGVNQAMDASIAELESVSERSKPLGFVAVMDGGTAAKLKGDFVDFDLDKGEGEVFVNSSGHRTTQWIHQ